jgi:hypothetical protein
MYIFGVPCVCAILSCFFLYYVNYVESGFIFRKSSSRRTKRSSCSNIARTLLSSKLERMCSSGPPNLCGYSFCLQYR